MICSGQDSYDHVILMKHIKYHALTGHLSSYITVAGWSLFIFRTVSILLDVYSTIFQKYSSEILSYNDIIIFHSYYRFVSCFFYDMNPSFTTSKMCSIGLTSGDWRSTVNSPSCHVKTDELSFMTWCIILLQDTIRRWVNCGCKRVNKASSNWWI